MTEQLPDLESLVADRPALERAAAVALERLVGAEGLDRVRLLGYLGNAERGLGNHEQSIAYLSEAVDLASQHGDEHARRVARIRLGESYRSANLLSDAEQLLRAAVDETVGTPLHDFALQHLGKCLIDQGRFDEATQTLRAALALRREKGDEQLVASTVAALERAARD